MWLLQSRDATIAVCLVFSVAVGADTLAAELRNQIGAVTLKDCNSFVVETTTPHGDFYPALVTSKHDKLDEDQKKIEEAKVIPGQVRPQSLRGYISNDCGLSEGKDTSPDFSSDVSKCAIHHDTMTTARANALFFAGVGMLSLSVLMVPPKWRCVWIYRWSSKCNKQLEMVNLLSLATLSKPQHGVRAWRNAAHC